MTPDREAFVRDNAVALVAQLEAKCARQATELARLNQRVQALQAERDRLRAALDGVLVRDLDGRLGPA